MHDYTYWFYIKLVIVLLLGLLLARFFKKFTRVVLTRLMPVQQRMSDDFFHKLTFRSTIIGAMITLGAAAGLYWLIGKGEAYFIPSTTIPTRLESIPTIPAPQPEEITPTTITAVEEVRTIPTAEIPTDNEAQVFLQIYAFRQRTAAEKQVLYWAARTDYLVLLAYGAADTEPYKVLIGPFPTTTAAIDFRQGQGMRGFPRQLDDLELLSDE